MGPSGQMGLLKLVSVLFCFSLAPGLGWCYPDGAGSCSSPGKSKEHHGPATDGDGGYELVVVAPQTSNYPNQVKPL